jgi:hypothetical protein
MYKIDNPEITNEFHEAWCFAGQELSKQGQGSLNWLKAELNPPFVDHFSFRLGNQIFSILIDVIDSKGNNSIDDFEKQRQIKFCTKNNITPAVFTIVRNLTGKLDKASSDWNLIDTRTGEAFNPVEMISDAEIPVSEWELHDFGVQVVRNFLTSAGKKIFSFQSMLDLNPTIWFSEGEKRYFVIVRTAAYPALEAEKTENLIDTRIKGLQIALKVAKAENKPKIEKRIKGLEIAQKLTNKLISDMTDSMDRLTKGIVKIQPELLDE